MKNAVLAVAIVLGFAVSAPGQGREWGNKLFTDGSSHNFGNVARGAILSWKFKMYNKWSVDLKVTNIRVSCGCVKAWAPSPVIKSGENATIDITMDAHKFTGNKTVYIYVSLGSVSEGQQYITTATLDVSANSRADVVFNPGQVNFGVLPLGQSRTLSIDVDYAGNLDWKILGVADNSAPVKVEVVEMFRQRTNFMQVRYRLNVTLKKDAPPGTRRWEIPMKTNDPASPILPVLVEATVDAPLTVAPSTVSLGNVKVGEVAKQKVLVRGSKPFRILSVEGSNQDISVELPASAATVQLVQIVYRPTKAGDLQQTLTFRTDLGSGATAKVKIAGSGTAPTP